MGELVRKSHNVSLLMYHIVCVAKYRRLVITEEVDVVLKDNPSCDLQHSFLDTVGQDKQNNFQLEPARGDSMDMTW